MVSVEEILMMMTCKTSRMGRRTTLSEAMHGELSTHSSQPFVQAMMIVMVMVMVMMVMIIYDYA